MIVGTKMTGLRGVLIGTTEELLGIIETDMEGMINMSPRQGIEVKKMPLK